MSQTPRVNPDTSSAVDRLRETLVSRRPVYEGRLLHVYEDEVRLPTGREARREIVHHRGAVAIVATVSAGGIVLVRQWRHACERALWEIPAGTREEGEDPAVTARRELEEETGYTAARWRPLGEACVSPGYTREVLWFFRAEGLTEGTPATDPDELLDVRIFDPGELGELVRTGQTDCKTLGGLALAGLLPPLGEGS
ncbi:MAG: hydrolase [Chloroflexi bacterium]|jgi:ADP-ribose pyrophosphatase|nr:hydrolase [Chloroflexota bacterium]MEA2616896.1 ADP-ribose pyrophosphatase [Chloroflexota bacterium]